MSSKNKPLNLDKDILYDLYINQKMTSKEIANIFGCTSKAVRNYLAKYDIPIRQNGEADALERSKWTDEQEATRSKKFIQTWADTPDKIKQEITARRIKNNNSPEAIAKAKETKFKNQTSKKSQAEDDFYNKLKLFIDESDILRGYIEARYPHNCDFYIKSKDLFIEYQGHQTHGTQPYLKGDVYCEAELDYIKDHGYDIKTYIERDPNKIKTAKQNKLNLLLIYPKYDSYLIKDGVMTNIGKFDITKINELC